MKKSKDYSGNSKTSEADILFKHFSVWTHPWPIYEHQKEKIHKTVFLVKEVGTSKMPCLNCAARHKIKSFVL